MSSSRGMTRSETITMVAVIGGVLVAAGALVAWNTLRSHRQISRARDLAARTACAATLGGYGHAFALYEADNYTFPFLGSNLPVEQTRMAPTGANSAEELFVSQRDSAIQTYWLLVNGGMLSDGQFRCPADESYLPPDRAEAKYGFTDWHNTSFAVQPTTDRWNARLSANLSGGVVILADKPDPDNLDGGSANHGEGINYLNMNSSIVWSEGQKNTIVLDGDHIYRNDGNHETDSYLLWGTGD
ncbi:MAG: hypothetical protein ACLFUJ_06870 [Phycisphaerae bacterium]